MVELNLSGLVVDASGRASFSGLTSGIDFRDVTDKIIEAKRIPAVTLENRITENDAKIVAYNELRVLLDSLRSAVSGLRGAVSVGGSGDIFRNKQVFASTSRVDGVTPSAAGNLVGVTVTNAAAAGSHTFEVRRIAAAHKVSSSEFTSTTAALSISGSITVGSGANESTVTVLSSDSLLDIRDRINNANSGITPTGVTASIVSVSATENFLVLTNDNAGANMVVTDTGSVLSGLGLSTTNGLGNLRNGLSSGSKVGVADGFAQFLFDGAQGDSAFLVTYDSGTRNLTLTRGDGEAETVTLAAGAIGSGATETATFSKLGFTIVLDENFEKGNAITVAADTVSVADGQGAIDASSVNIFDSEGDVSAITSTTLTFGNLGSPAALTITAAGGFSGTLDASTTGVKTLTLTDSSGNELLVQFNVTTAFDGTESAASIELHELENLVASNNTQFTNVMQEAQTARFTADGLTDATHFESGSVTSKTAALTNFAPNATFPGSFDIVGTGTSTISYTSSDTLETLRDKINAVTATTGVTARTIKDSNGFRLELNASSAFSLTDTNGLLADLDVNQDRVIVRQSNTVADLFTGVTLSFFQQEPGTTIKIDIEQDLAAVETKIVAFVDAYNEVRRFINTHSQTDATTGTKSEDAGVLFGESTISSLQTQLSSLVNGNVDGASADFSILAQIGITLVINASVADPLDKETLEIDGSALDNALLNNADDVRRLFTFDFSSSSPDVVLLDHTVATTRSTTPYTLNVNFDDRFRGDAITNNTLFAQVDAETGGPASDGISAITFGDSVSTGEAFRYSYDAGAEQLTLINLTTGASEVKSVAALIDAVAGVGNDLGASETVAIVFSSLDVTITLSGDDGFLRGTPISDGALDVSLLTNTTMVGGTVATPTSSMNKATVDALIAAGAYNQADGLLTLSIGSTGSGEAHVNTAAGILFKIDGGLVLADISGTDLDDTLSHNIGIFVNDGSSDVLVATLSFTTLTGAAFDAGQNITIDLGTGLVAETSTITSATASMSNYLSVSDGSFEIRDSLGGLIGTVNYLAAESLTDVAATANGISGITAQVVASGNTFLLEIVEDNNDAITLQSDTGSLVSEHGIVDVGNAVFSANIGGAANGLGDGTATASGTIITVSSLSTAEGLRILYTGSADASGIQIDFTIGVAAQLFYALDSFLDITSGTIQGEIATLEGKTLLAEQRIESIDTRLALKRDSLIARFIAAELALARMNSLIDLMKQTFEALAASKR